MNCELLPILTDYANYKKEGMKLKKNHLKKFLFLVTAAIFNGGRGCRTQF
jgi:hypothetical protein